MKKPTKQKNKKKIIKRKNPSVSFKERLTDLSEDALLIRNEQMVYYYKGQLRMLNTLQTKGFLTEAAANKGLDLIDREIQLLLV